MNRSYYPSPDDHESIRWLCYQLDGLFVTDKLPHFLFGFSMYDNCSIVQNPVMYLRENYLRISIEIPAGSYVI